MTVPEPKDILDKSEPTIYWHLKKLISEGIIKRNGSKKTGHWEVINDKN